LHRTPIRPVDETSSQFYLSLDAADQPGVLAAIAGVFGTHEVSIQSMQQKGHDAEARLIFVTHVAKEAAMAATIRDVRELDTVERVGSVLRVVGGEE
jgi:homoserine dehydrogenase